MFRSPSPFAGIFLGLAFFALLIFLFIFVQIGLLTVAFSKLGLTPFQGFAVLLMTLIGSRINIPVYKTGRLVSSPMQNMFRFGPMGMQFPQQDMGERDLQEQIIAVNLGGCIIPCLLSLWLYSQLDVEVVTSQGLALIVLLCIGVVSAACFKLANPVAGVGISIPVFIPPLVTALVAMILVPQPHTPVVAYIAGSLGTLIGADVLNLLKPRTIATLDAPLLSIGGAGTFDGIFLTGILAVLLA